MKFFTKKISSFIVVAFFSILFSACYLPKAVALRDVFDNYGFKEPQQKEALEYLLKEASVIENGQSLESRFPKRQNQTALLKDTVEFIKLTQERFWLRKGTEERWEAKPQSWMLKEKSSTLDALKTLGLVFEVSPKNAHPDVICILGAPLNVMEDRIGYAEKLLAEQKVFSKYLVLLAGERSVAVGIDGTKEELLNIAKRFGYKDFSALTETHLIEEVYKNSALFNKLEVVIIDTPRRDLPRPTTETTTLEFINWLRLNPQFKSVLFVSNQPYVQYQQAVIAEVFKAENFPVDFEVVGAKASKPLNIQMLMESLGSYLWAKTPQVVRELHLKSSDQEVVQQFKYLYRNNPVIYQHLKI